MHKKTKDWGGRSKQRGRCSSRTKIGTPLEMRARWVQDTNQEVPKRPGPRTLWGKKGGGGKLRGGRNEFSRESCKKLLANLHDLAGQRNSGAGQTSSKAREAGDWETRT